MQGLEAGGRPDSAGFQAADRRQSGPANPTHNPATRGHLCTTSVGSGSDVSVQNGGEGMLPIDSSPLMGVHLVHLHEGGFYE